MPKRISAKKLAACRRNSRMADVRAAGRKGGQAMRRRCLRLRIYPPLSRDWLALLAD